MFRELACTVKRDNLTHDFLLDKTPGPIARGAFFVREKLFNAVIIQRGHVVGTRSHARKFNEHPTRRQRLATRLSLVVISSEVETSLDGSERVRDLIRSLPLRSAAGRPVDVAASPAASFQTAFRCASLRSEQTVIA